MLTPVAFIADAPDSVTLNDEGKSTSRIQIAKTGRFKDPRYGTFSITAQDFQTWMRNFSKFHAPPVRLGLPVDRDHKPEKEGDTEACGWLLNIDTMGEDSKTPTPNELWATVEFNALGKELIEDKRYAYLSPSYTHNYADEEGKKHGTALVGVALTNRPFLTMATVSLSKDALLAEDDPTPDPSLDSPEQMHTLSTGIAAALGVSPDADEATVLSAIQAKVSPASADINLSELAKSQGMVVLSTEQVSTLTADAEAGRKAGEKLSEMTFSTAWDTAVDKGRKVPAERDIFLALYEVKPEETLQALKDAPQVLSTELRGSGGGSGEGASETRDGEFVVDSDRAELHKRVLSVMTEQKINDYGQALDVVLAQGN